MNNKSKVIGTVALGATAYLLRIKESREKVKKGIQSFTKPETIDKVKSQVQTYVKPETVDKIKNGVQTYVKPETVDKIKNGVQSFITSKTNKDTKDQDASLGMETNSMENNTQPLLQIDPTKEREKKEEL